jgi:L-ribulose-5-phosphate 3-epimerase UlaE
MIAGAANLDMARRLRVFGEKSNTLVALRNAAAASLEEAAGSRSYRIDFDIGDFTAANRQAVAFIQENHASIGQIVVKDRTRDSGSNEEFGNGDAPIKPVLGLLKEKHYGIPVFVQYEYLGLGTPVQEVKKCMAYVHAALA